MDVMKMLRTLCNNLLCVVFYDMTKAKSQFLIS